MPTSTFSRRARLSEQRKQSFVGEIGFFEPQKQKSVRTGHERLFQSPRLGMKMMRGAATSIWSLFNMRQPQGIGEKSQSPFCPTLSDSMGCETIRWVGEVQCYAFLPCLQTTWLPWPPAAASGGPLRPSWSHPPCTLASANGMASRAASPHHPMGNQCGL